jgi:torulene dioxygenase
VPDTPKGTFYVSHWFDGFAHTHRFDIVAPSANETDGKVRVFYSSRRQSEALRADIRMTGRRRMFSFAQRRDPCMGIFGKIMSLFDKSKGWYEENICVVVNPSIPGLESSSLPERPIVAGHRADVTNIWLTTDNSSLLEIDVTSLEPVGFAKQTKFHPDLKGPSSCAHVQRDPKNGDYFNFNLEYGRIATYRIFRVSATTGETEILATIFDPTVKAAYIHSLFLTENYVVLCVPSSHYGLNGAKVVWQKNMLDSIEPFDETKTCKWFVVDRRNAKGVVGRFETPAGFFFHSINAFEEAAEDGKSVDVLCDLVHYNNLDIMHGFYYDVLMDRDNGASKFWNDDHIKNCLAKIGRFRFTIPLHPTKGEAPAEVGQAITFGTWALERTIPAPHAGEVPTINPAYNSRKYRYSYSIGTRGLSTLQDCIVKTDIASGEALMWRAPHGNTPGEAIFVARLPVDEEQEAEMAEDDGVLLSIVLDGTSQKSYLLCLSAQTMQEVGRASCDFAVPFNFHGIHARAARD